MRSLNVIGAGRVGTTLAALWQRNGVFAVQDVLDGTAAGAKRATELIDGGEPVPSLASMRAADAWMITTPDRLVAKSAGEVSASGLLRPGDMVFHCSGSLSSAELGAARACGATVASVHPLKSFADAHAAIETFAGTFCAAEGDAVAVSILTAAFEAIGGRVSGIDARYKTVYHAASVMVSNYVTALLEIGLRCYEKAGMPRATATTMIEPIVVDTVYSIFRLGPARALTGPIARGDAETVERHVEALTAWDPEVTAAYRVLGLAAVDLAREHGEAEAEALSRIEALLGR